MNTEEQEAQAEKNLIELIKELNGKSV